MALLIGAAAAPSKEAAKQKAGKTAKPSHTLNNHTREFSRLVRHSRENARLSTRSVAPAASQSKSSRKMLDNAPACSVDRHGALSQIPTKNARECAGLPLNKSTSSDIQRRTCPHKHEKMPNEAPLRKLPETTLTICHMCWKITTSKGDIKVSDLQPMSKAEKSATSIDACGFHCFGPVAPRASALLASWPARARRAHPAMLVACQAMLRQTRKRPVRISTELYCIETQGCGEAQEHPLRHTWRGNRQYLQNTERKIILPNLLRVRVRRLGCQGRRSATPVSAKR